MSSYLDWEMGVEFADQGLKGAAGSHVINSTRRSERAISSRRNKVGTSVPPNVLKQMEMRGYLGNGLISVVSNRRIEMLRRPRALLSQQLSR